MLTGHGLAVALKQSAAHCRPGALERDADGRLPEPVEVAAYYVVRESLTNIGDDARATSVRVGSPARPGLVVEVVDDGIGGADTERGRACAVSPTVSRRTAAGFGSGVPPAAAPASGGDPVRVAIAEDSVLLREGLTRLLGDAGLDVVAEYENVDDLLR